MSISSIVDIVFVALLILLAVIGLYKGFLKSAISMIGSLASFLIAYVIAEPFGKLLDGMFKITSSIATKVTEWLNSLGEFFSTVRVGEDFSAIGGEMMSGGISGVVQSLTNMLLKGANIPEGSSVGQVLGDKIAAVITTLIAGVVAFVLIRIILKILEKLADKITEVKIFGAIDKILGFVFGLAKALLYSGAAVVIMTVVGYFIPSLDTKIDGIVSETKAFQKYYDFINYEIVEFIDEKLGKTPVEDPVVPEDEPIAEIALADFTATNLEGMAYAYYTRTSGSEAGSVYFSDEAITADNYATISDFLVKYTTYIELDSIDAIVDGLAEPLTKTYAEVTVEKTLTEIEGLYEIITHYYIDQTNKVVVFKQNNADVDIANYAFDCDYKVSFEDQAGLDAIELSITTYNDTAATDLIETVGV